MRRESREKSVVGKMRHAEFRTGPAHDRCELRVVDVTHAWEQVVLDLEVETPQIPGEEPIAGREVDRRGELVLGPRLREAAVARSGRERGPLDAVGELEDDREAHS